MPRMASLYVKQLIWYIVAEFTHSLMVSYPWGFFIKPQVKYASYQKL